MRLRLPYAQIRKVAALRSGLDDCGTGGSDDLARASGEALNPLLATGGCDLTLLRQRLVLC